MKRTIGACAVAAATLGVAGQAHGQLFGRAKPTTAIENARIESMWGPQPVIEGGTIVFSDGRIVRIGRDVPLPDKATVVDASGLVATPGLIDVDGSLTLAVEGGGNPLSRGVDGFDRYAARELREALRNGVTMVCVSPGGPGGVSGVASVIRLAPGEGRSAGEPVVEEAAIVVDMGSGGAALARIETLNRVRKDFQTAIDYRESREIYDEELEEYEKKLKELAAAEAKDKKDGGDAKGEDKKVEKPDESGKKKPAGIERLADGDPPDAGAEKKDGEKDEELKKPAEPGRDAKSELLLRAIDHEIPVWFRAERSEEILNALEVMEEFRLSGTIVGGTEAHLVADALADAEVGVVLHDVAESGLISDDANARRSRHAARRLDTAGVRWVVGTGGRGGSAGRFVLLTAQRVASGAHEDALALVTTRAAGFLGVEDRFGRLRAGDAADIVLWTGDPRDPTSRVHSVYVNGELMYRDESAAGGDAARGDDQ